MLFPTVGMNTTSNSTRNTYEADVWLPNLVLKIFTSIFAISGIPGNLVVLILIGNKFMTRKPYEWLLFNLALVDFCHCVNNLFLQVQFIGRYGTVQCQVSGFMQYLTGFQTFLVPPIIAYNRYLSLHDSYKCGLTFTRCKTAVMCVSTWIFSATAFLPFAVTGDLGEDDLGTCGLLRKINGKVLQLPLGYIILITSTRVIIGLCYVVLFLCTYRIVHKLRSHAVLTSSTVHSRLMDESKELVTLTSLIFLIPFVTQSPAMTAKTALLFVPHTFSLDAWYARALVAVFAFPAAIDPYMTLYVVKDYRKIVGRCLKCN